MAELASAEAALDAAGIEININVDGAQMNPAHETTMAWALREAITNVVKHSGAQMCWITVHSVDGSTSLEVEDDGGGPGEGTFGTGLNGLADRIHGLGGSLTAERREQCGFRLWVQLGSVAATPPIGVRAE